MTLATFVAKWTAVTTGERASAQSHFNDLCHMLGQQTTHEADPRGEWFAFEKGAVQSTGTPGWADVWRKGSFAWEYKGHRANLKEAYDQVLRYREDLENPPLLVVCDLNRFEVHTNFTGTAKRVYAFDLADLGRNAPTPTCALPPLEVLRALFTDPDRLKPTRTTTQVTEAAAREFAKLAGSLQGRGEDPERAAHFLMRLLFCLFAEDIDLLKSNLFSRLVENTRFRPADLSTRLKTLFEAMAVGGSFGADDIEHFNGGLFADAETLDLNSQDIEVLFDACKLDWASVEPAIFGTLFERSLDPNKRAQLGAHYTSRDDIMLVVEPVLMEPLRRRWAVVREEAEKLIARRDAATGQMRRNREQDLERLLRSFQAEIASTRVLDPACGSGNFLYVALKRLLDLEKEVLTFMAANGLTMAIPEVGPEQLFGIEINPYAHELAQVVVWIGYIQWLKDNGFGIPSSPILKPLDNIRRMDAVVAHDDQGQPIEPAWPDADVLIGNPPFLGGNRIRNRLGDEYVDELFAVYRGRVPAFSDLVCYWFDHARTMIESGRSKRAGLLATQAIRGGVNRKVLDDIKQSGDVFWAHSDRNWILDGAAVHVSMIGFDDGTEQSRTLNDQVVTKINANLTPGVDLTAAAMLRENQDISYQGPSPKAPFDIDAATAMSLLTAPTNINGQPNSVVVRRLFGAIDLNQGWRGLWTIDFGLLDLETAVQFEAPFEYVKQHVYPVRMQGRRARYAGNWWQYGRPRPNMRRSLAGKTRYIATARHTRHRIFVWVEPDVLCNDSTIVFARDDDYFFGVLHSRPHELWARGKGTQVREVESGFRYTPTTTFETFPLPWPPGQEPLADSRVLAIAEAARELSHKRQAALTASGGSRTLNDLYNEPPTWLQIAHQELDQAVLDAYGWEHNLSDENILERLLALNLQRAANSS